jgi:hypothetical protein
MSLQQELMERLDKHTQAVQSFMFDSTSRLVRIETLVEDIPKRVTALERFKWQLLGGVAVISAACSFIFRHIF